MSIFKSTKRMAAITIAVCAIVIGAAITVSAACARGGMHAIGSIIRIQVPGETSEHLVPIMTHDERGAGSITYETCYATKYNTFEYSECLSCGEATELKPARVQKIDIRHSNPKCKNGAIVVLN
ncbi:MAG: hypothetical protein FWG90_10325 [Oscillospiraceae bacterium]|nr:hypothetical protein [Oscillospiraceae bacterium]